ncbi:MAG: MFS transporter [Dehalococcoidia bacterium]|nr:MFS transporter [Dehalococcoidia bacterium]
MTSGRRKRSRYFYGWNIVAASFMAHLAYAEQFSSTLGLFFNPLTREFGWTRTQISIVQTISRVVEAGTAPLAGPLVDRFGARTLLPVGALVAGTALVGVTFVESLWQFYIVRGFVAAIGFTLMGNLVTSVAINNWFIRMRGRALAISSTGASISNVVMIPVAVYVIAEYGWREMFWIFAIITWIVVLAPSTILIRRRPEDMGLRPDGVEPDDPQGPARTTLLPEQQRAASQEQAMPEPVWTRKEALRAPAFWLIAGCFAISSLAFQGINISLAPYVQDLGYEEALVAAALTTRAIVMAVTLPVVGLVAERSNMGPVRALPFILQTIGCVLFLFADEVYFLFPALIVYGMGITSLGVTQEVLWANSFGRLSLGSIRSMGFVVTFGFGATGPIVMSLIYDLLGSYRPAFLIFIAFFAVSAVLILFLRPPRPPRYARAG